MKQSSNIQSIAYDPAKQELTVNFHGGGTYRYANVSQEEFNAFDKAESPGKHFHKHVRSKQTTRVGGKQ